MPSTTRLIALAALLVSVTALVPPGLQGSLNQAPANTTAPTTDVDLIAQTAGEVDQKTSGPIDAPPNAAVPPTTVTALDGTIVNTTIAGASTSTTRRREIDIGRFGKRQAGQYVELFAPLAAGVHDASIEGTAYLTYTVVNNATYNIDDCLAFCDTVDGCEFVNLYYEFNNFLLDFVFSQESNLKCAAYGDIHNATEKTNFGGQASYPQVGNETVPLTFITQSSGWAAKELTDPATPDGYELVFGPTDGANNAPGYMGFAFIDKYDVGACASLCNGRGADPAGGVCQFFNIWRALVDGVPTTYTCAMLTLVLQYFLVADESTAVNFGQGDLVVTLSRGYSRISAATDGGFEGFTECDDFCFDTSYANWIGTSSPGGDEDATIFFFPPYAHTGHGSGLLGAAFGDDALSGTLTPAAPLTTESGKNYVVQVFVSNDFSGQPIEDPAFVDVLWNGVRVGGVTGFQHYTPLQVSVVGTGKDVLAFRGGDAPAWSFIDDVSVFGLLE
ncbi:hypothetical protein B0H11DRAFT_2184145 [Mycena galericulata]|nr:hypothetical protein B0H11DRAFT_2184145 [Mycena galericulata]